MASKFNSEFNYRYQVIGETPWEKIKTLQGFLEGRVRAVSLEEVGRLKLQSKISELKHLEENKGLEHKILHLRAEIMEIKSHDATVKEAYELNHAEVKILKKLLDELYVIAEPSRIAGYSDEEMYEVNAVNEFTVAIGKELQSEMIANGRPSPAKIRTAMRNPYTWNALKQIGIIPKEAKLIEGNINPRLKIELKGVEDEAIQD